MATRKAKATKKKTSSVSVNFEGVEVSRKIQPGRYLATVDSVELKESDSGNEYLNWKLDVDGSVMYYITSLQPQALFNLRSVMEAAGLEVEEAEMDLDLDEFAGLEFGVEVDNEVYQGKKRARVVDVFPADEVEGEPEEEPEPTQPAKKGKKAAEPEPEEPEFEEGQTVTFKDGKKEFEGTVVGPNDDGDGYIVEVDGEEWDISTDDLTLVEKKAATKAQRKTRK